MFLVGLKSARSVNSPPAVTKAKTTAMTYNPPGTAAVTVSLLYHEALVQRGKVREGGRVREDKRA